jgi:hypothetical protein
MEANPAAFVRASTDGLGLRCCPVWQGRVPQAAVEPNGETVPPVQSAQQLVVRQARSYLVVTHISLVLIFYQVAMQLD